MLIEITNFWPGEDTETYRVEHPDEVEDAHDRSVANMLYNYGTYILGAWVQAGITMAIWVKERE